jgi:hypothetical protein
MQVTLTVNNEVHGFTFGEDVTIYKRPNGEVVAIPSAVFLTAAELLDRQYDIPMLRPDHSSEVIQSPTQRRLDDMQHQITVLSEAVSRVADT